MKTQYKPTFLKDLKSLQRTPVYEKIKALSFFEIPQYEQISDIPHLSKIKGANNAYRVRVGDYRIGILEKDHVLIFVRCLHRKEIYRYFP